MSQAKLSKQVLHSIQYHEKRLAPYLHIAQIKIDLCYRLRLQHQCYVKKKRGVIIFFRSK